MKKLVPTPSSWVNCLATPNKNIILLLVLFLFCNCIFAQNQSTAPAVKELNAYINTLKSNNQSSGESLEHLIYDLQPSIYYLSGKIEIYGDKPNTLYTEINSIKDANNSALLINDIELINIKIVDTTKKIDLSNFSNYKNLKYIYIVSKINLTDSEVAKMIINYDEKYTIIYKTLKEE
ncbi:hypothetical protein [Flavobacterium eburneipallidum]|uniref:hypothetical protein n=1 Tax=Flavobacterium eburneipallidum TaxID=3003263 RepID=UPI0022AC6F48|nr:hypothetical protein [Flavobacterium eburneipallidum]